MYRCGKCQSNFDPERFPVCPRCDPTVQHPEPEDAVFACIAALSGLYDGRTWFDHATCADDYDQINRIARLADKLTAEAKDFIGRIREDANEKARAA